LTSRASEEAQLKEVNGSNNEAITIKGLMLTPLTLTYSLFHKDYDDKDKIIRRERHPRDDYWDLIIEAPELDDNLKLENNLDWVQANEMILKLREYNEEKSFKLAILKMKVCLSLV